MRIVLAKSLLAVAVALSAAIAPTSAGGKASTAALVGLDVSYPQCYKSLPSGEAFAVVGINDGLANTTNPCLTKQLAWAAGSSGKSNQPKIQLYVNTANPGGLNTPSWPKDNNDPTGNTTDNPYGTCDGSDSLACSYQYGWNRANEDGNDRLAPAASAAGLPASASNYKWWLDVETVNSWETGDANAQAKNSADLEGMTAYLKGQGAEVGLYSTSAQWAEVAGRVDPTSNLTGLTNWRPGAKSVNTAKSNCSLAPLTAGGKVTLTQYQSGNLDYDYSCIN